MSTSKGPDTDLRFSIKGIPAIICGGDRNIPDGEVFSCPVKDSVEGHVTFNAPSIYQGTRFRRHPSGIQERKDRRGDEQRDAKAEQDPRLRSGRALHRRVLTRLQSPRVSTRCATSCSTRRSPARFHFTPGQAYEEADNGNRSQVHWDMVNIQRPDYGGGEIYFDGKLIRKDGKFLPKQLRSLNWK